jgi:hypothetical protein
MRGLLAEDNAIKAGYPPSELAGAGGNRQRKPQQGGGTRLRVMAFTERAFRPLHALS